MNFIKTIVVIILTGIIIVVRFYSSVLHVIFPKKDFFSKIDLSYYDEWYERFGVVILGIVSLGLGIFYIFNSIKTLTKLFGETKYWNKNALEIKIGIGIGYLILSYFMTWVARGLILESDWAIVLVILVFSAISFAIIYGASASEDH